MAEGTIILRPVADIVFNHTGYNGDNESNTGWNLIDDITPDEGSTHITHTVQVADSAESKSSMFSLGGTTPANGFRIMTVTAVFNLCITGENNSLRIDFIIDGSSFFSTTNAIVPQKDSEGASQYGDLIVDCSESVAILNNYISSNNEFPQINLQITTAFPATEAKQDIDITQVYLELGYKTGLGIYKKVNGVWTQAQAAYKKTGGVWVGMTEAECKQYMQSVNIKQ